MAVSNQESERIVSILVVALWIGLLGTGCTSASLVTADYSTNENVTTYETNQVSLAGSDWGSGYGSSKSLEVWAKAQCQGQGCKPNRVTLIFQVSGSGSLRLQNRTVELKANGQTIGSNRHPRATGRDIDELSSALGVVATMRMSFRDFRTLAEAERITGTIGTSSFQLRRQSRAPFRALVQKATAPAETETSAESS